MAVLEIMTFRLAGDADEAAFLDADRRFQTEFGYQQAGLLRRTTARGEDGEWTVVTLWETGADADVAAGRATGDPAASRFLALLETVRTRRYTTLD